MPTYGSWLSRDPRLWGSVSQGRWSGNSYAITNFVIICNAGEEGHMIMHQPFEEGFAGTFVVEGYMTNTNSGDSGFRPMVFGTLGDEINTDGPFSVEVEVTTPTSDFWGFRSTGNGNAQIAAGSAPNDRVDLRELIDD